MNKTDTQLTAEYLANGGSTEGAALHVMLYRHLQRKGIEPEPGKMYIIGGTVSNYYDNCEHEWIECPYDTMADGKPGHTQMICKKCRVPGERTDSTGEVFWPTT